MSADLQELLDTIADLVADKVAAKLAVNAKGVVATTWGTRKQSAEHTGCSVRTLEALGAKGPPFIKVGRSTRYDLSPGGAVDKWMRGSSTLRQGKKP